MANDLAKLNRLRVNAGKKELTAWKAGQEQLDMTIAGLEEKGFDDSLPGALPDAAPVTDDPEIAKVIAPTEDDKPKAEPEVVKAPVGLARGLDNEELARNSRARVRDAREAVSKSKKAATKERKQADKEAAKAEKKIAGKVDAKKEPEKAKRQEKHVADKQKARAEKPKAEANPNEITVADVARELGIDPKTARNKLRRHAEKVDKLRTKGYEEGWTFPKSAKAKLVEILK